MDKILLLVSDMYISVLKKKFLSITHLHGEVHPVNYNSF